MQPDGFSPKMTEALIRKVEGASLPAAELIDLLDAGISRQGRDAGISRCDVCRGVAEGVAQGTRALWQEKAKRESTCSCWTARSSGHARRGAGCGWKVLSRRRRTQRPDSGQGVGLFEMHLNSPEYAVVLNGPCSGRRNTTVAAGGAGRSAVPVTGLGWLLRKQVRQGTRVLHEEIEERQARRGGIA